MSIEKIRKARANALLDRPFYGSIAMNWDLVEDPGAETLWTDGKKLGFNPQYVSEMKDHYLKTAIAHEAKHVTDMHHLRRGGRDHRLWNEACDIVVNDWLASEGFDVHPDWLIGAKYGIDGTKYAAEQVYEILKQKQMQHEQGDDNNAGDGDHQGQGSPSPGPGEVRDYPSESGQLSSAEVKAAENELRTQMVKAATQAKAWGKLPGELERMIKEIIDPQMPWQEILKRFIQKVAKNDYKFFPPNRRHVASGLYLPSLRSDELESVVIAVDTSGSISEDDLNKFASEISGILEAYDCDIQVIYFDAEVVGYEHFTREDMPIKLTPKGGGGTNFVPPMRWVNKYLDVEPDCMIYLTDMQCNLFPEEPSFPVLWVSTTDYQEAPFGETVRMR